MRLIIGNIYQGRHDFVINKYGENVSILDDLEERMKAGQSVEELLKLSLDYDVCIVTEGYGGLTQIDKEERDFAKSYGQILVELSRKAESVERVVCGLGMTIK